nr:alpha-2-macroglobulin family protein [bacterium]
NFEVQGNILNANCKFEKEKIYKIIISPANIKDIDNRILDLTGDVEFYFYIKRSEPFFNWKQSEGIVELFGPQEFPSTGRGEEKIDLRIYKIDPLNRAFWPFPEKPIVIDEKKEPPRPGQEPITNHPDAELIKILEQRREYYNEEGEQYYPEDNNDKIADYVTDAQISKHLKLLGSPLISKIIELPSADFNKTIEFGLPLKKYFEDISGTGKAGTYLVGIRRLNGETTRKYVRIQATDLCLSVIEEKRSIKFAVTSLKTGKPVKSAHIKIQGIYYNQNNNNWENLIEGISDENGVFNYVHKKAISANLKRIIVSKDDDMLVLNPSSPPPYFVNNHWHRTENSNWLSWLNNVPYSTENDINYLLHIFTERPIYKPDEEVFIKGYIRKKENGILEFPPDELKNRFVLEISAVGNKKWKSNISLNRFGSFDYVFKEKDLPTGNYTVCVFDLKEKIFLDVQTGFKKEAYKIPTFDIQIYASDSVPNDRPFPVKATAEYYAGGKITNRPVQWRIIQYPYAYFTETKDGFIYSSDNRFGNYQSFSDYGMKEDTGIIDYSGECNMAINPGAEIDGSARVYSIEATVTDIDMQTVTRTKEVISLPPFVIGLKNKKIFYKADLIKPEYKVLSFGGGFAENVNLNVKLLKREWHSYLREANFSQSKAEYVTESVDNLMFEKKILSSKKVETINIPELNSGVYILEIEGRDMLGRIQAVSSDFYVSNSDKPVSWEKAVDNVFKTVSDKDGYVPGETAKMVVKSPFSTGNILTVVEHPEKNIYKWNSVENGNAIIEIPIEKCFTPQLAVHFLLMRGRNGDSDNSTQNRRIDVNKPQTVCATNYIKVKPVENQIEMKLEHPKTVLPGSEVSIKIELKDNNSKPLSGELTLWLVDEAVLSLAPEKNIDPLKNMIKPVSSSIRITDYRNKIIGKVLLNEETGGDGKTHGDVKTKNTVRKNFKTVPYYNPSIIIGDSGVALVKFRISDDLTNFKIRAVVCGNSGERFGSAKSSISVRLPVIVQPALPRFVRIGDEFKAGGIGRIIEGASGDAKCSIETENALVSGTASKKFFLNSNKSEQIYFDMKVPVPELIKSGKTVQSEMKIKLSLTREYDNAGDAFEISIPIKDDRRKISYQYDTELISGLIYYLPEPKEKYRGNSLIKEFMATDKIAVLKTANALAFLARYPHGCLEQKISQSYSSIALRGILERFNMTELVKTIDEKINETFFYLEQCLGADGLYSYWPGSEGYVYLTAYIVEFLTEAKRAGYKFPDKLLARPITHLQKALRSDYENFIDGQSFLERVESLYALGRAGYFDASYARELSSKINYMNLFSKSRLMLALLENKGKSDKKNIEQLRKEIWENTIFTLRDGIEKYSGLQKFTGSPNDDLVLSSEKRTLANVIRSLWRTDSNNEKLNQMINELAIVGTGDGWGNTINNASALLALNDVISVPEKKYDETKFEVSTGKIYDDFKLTAKNPIYFYKTNSSEKTKIVMKESDKKVFGSFKMSYIPDLDGSFVKQENNGFVIENEFIKIDESNNIIKREKINKSGLSLKYSPGDIIEIHISVINPKKQNFVAITIPIAAGFEPMNPELSTSSHLAKPAGKITKTPSYSMYLDDEVKYYYNELPQGNYDFYFRVKAAIEGNFTNPAAFAELMYNDNIRGNSFGTKIKINN